MSHNIPTNLNKRIKLKCCQPAKVITYKLSGLVGCGHKDNKVTSAISFLF